MPLKSPISVPAARMARTFALPSAAVPPVTVPLIFVPKRLITLPSVFLPEPP